MVVSYIIIFGTAIDKIVEEADKNSYFLFYQKLNYLILVLNQNLFMKIEKCTK